MGNLIRVTLNKSFGECVETRATFGTNSSIPVSNVIVDKKSAKIKTSAVDDVVESSKLYDNVPILGMIGFSRDGSGAIPLSRQFGFKVGESFNAQKNNDEALKYADRGASFWDIINQPEVKAELCSEAKRMFPEVNPMTGKPDIDKHKYYTSFIPLVINSGAMVAQQDLRGNKYFNPDGTVLVADVFAGLQGVRDDIIRSNTSVDGVAQEGEYFTEGYNSIVDGRSSLLYRIYTRREMSKPITRAELAYITVVGWKPFRGNRKLFGGKFHVGYRVNWETPAKYVGKFRDAKTIRASKKISGNTDLENGEEIMDVNLRSWKGDMTLKSYLDGVMNGKYALPLPMLMSMVELDALDLFYYEGSELAPLKQVSRGEFCYFITKLSKVFSTEFKSSGDNTYI